MVNGVSFHEKILRIGIYVWLRQILKRIKTYPSVGSELITPEKGKLEELSISLSYISDFSPSFPTKGGVEW